jgi:hypothetical protein
MPQDYAQQPLSAQGVDAFRSCTNLTVRRVAALVM